MSIHKVGDTVVINENYREYVKDSEADEHIGREVVVTRISATGRHLTVELDGENIPFPFTDRELDAIAPNPRVIELARAVLRQHAKLMRVIGNEQNKNGLRGLGTENLAQAAELDAFADRL